MTCENVEIRRGSREYVVMVVIGDHDLTLVDLELAIIDQSEDAVPDGTTWYTPDVTEHPSTEEITAKLLVSSGADVDATVELDPGWYRLVSRVDDSPEGPIVFSEDVFRVR